MFFYFSLIRNKMNDRCERKSSQTHSEYYADHGAHHGQARLSDTYLMAAFSRKNFATVVKFFNMIDLYT